MSINGCRLRAARAVLVGIAAQLAGVMFVPAAAPSATGVRTQGNAEAALTKARTALEQMQVLGHAVRRYVDRHFHLPSSLADLSPEFLDTPITRNPFGGAYQFEPFGRAWRLRTALPFGLDIEMVREDFTLLPLELLSDGEVNRWTRTMLRRIGTAIESYRIDYNVYPTRLEALAPDYIDQVPLRDPFGRLFLADLHDTTYSVSSLGRDGAPGGAGVDTDVSVTTGAILSTPLPDVSQREYMRVTAWALRDATWAVQSYVVDFKRLPTALTDVEPTYIVKVKPDGCGRAFEYRQGRNGHSYVITAPGYPCGATPEAPLGTRCDLVGGEGCNGAVLGLADSADLID